MKICFLCNEYPPEPHGGIGTFVRVLGRALAQAGHEVRALGCSKTSSTAAAYEEDQGVRIWRQRMSGGRWGWVRARYALYRTLRQWARAGEIDLVEAPDYQGWAAGWPGLPVPLVVRLHGSATYFAHEMGQSLTGVPRWLERRSLLRADAWCSVSQYTADVTARLFRLPRPCAAVLYNPVEAPAVLPGGSRSRCEVVFTGTLTEKKGLIPLFRSWPAVLRQRPDARLHIYGKDGRQAGGSMREHLLGLLSEAERASVEFHGHQPRELIFQALDRARLAVFPSYAEAFAIAPLEAMARGCPTVYSRRGSGPELISHGQDGWLIDPDEPAQIADGVLRLLNDDALAAELATCGRQRILQGFTLDRIVPQNEAFYRECQAAFANRGLRRAVSLSRLTNEALPS